VVTGFRLAVFHTRERDLVGRKFVVSSPGTFSTGMKPAAT
jgi:hypothetical protein